MVLGILGDEDEKVPSDPGSPTGRRKTYTLLTGV